MSRPRFALLLDGPPLAAWHAQCIAQLEPVADLVAVARTNGPTGIGPSSAALRWYARRTARRSIAAAAGPAATHTADELEADARALELDFVLALGPGAARVGRRIEAAHGVWYFAHDRDVDLLPLFRDVYSGSPTTRVALLAERGRETSVLVDAHLRTERRSYARNRDLALGLAASWPARVCVRIASGAEHAQPLRAEPHTAARDRPVLRRYVARTALRRAERAAERLFRHPQWNIGVLEAAPGEILAGAETESRIRWFPLEGRGTFLADPFGIERDGRIDVLCERFSYRESRGHIVSASYGKDWSAEPDGIALRLPVHASYPFLLDEPDGVYCVPETARAGKVSLYRTTDFPRGWQEAAVLLDGFEGVDATVFAWQDRWWLFCTRRGAYEDVELFAWHADDLHGPWTAHRQNPIKSDVRSSRPAGPPFEVDGTLYRPAQDCSRRYGWRVAIARVSRLTPDDFDEDPVAIVEAPPGSPFPDGRHTFAVVGDVVLVDGLRRVFVAAAFTAFIRNWSRAAADRFVRRR